MFTISAIAIASAWWVFNCSPPCRLPVNCSFNSWRTVSLYWTWAIACWMPIQKHWRFSVWIKIFSERDRISTPFIIANGTAIFCCLRQCGVADKGIRRATHLRIAGVPMRNNRERQVGWLAILHDVSERKRAEEQIKSAYAARRAEAEAGSWDKQKSRIHPGAGPWVEDSLTPLWLPANY